MLGMGLGLTFPPKPVAAVVPFVPSDLANLVLWFDASDATTLFQDTAGATPVTADGQAVARWNDKSVSGYHVTQSIGSQQPSRQTSGVRFDGSNDQLNRTGMSLPDTNVTVFTVFSLATTSERGGIFRKGLSTNGWRIAVGLGNLSTLGNNLIWLANGSGTDTLVPLGTGRKLVVATQDTNTVILRLNGSQAWSGSSVPSGAATGIIVGAGTTASVFFTDDVHAVLVYTRVLSAGEISQVETYLATQWGTG